MQRMKQLIKDKLFKYYELNKLNIQIASNLSRAATAAACRNIDPHNPVTWEFSGFSQNGEDGILDYLISKLNKSNKYFIEIGASNGIENNTSYLAHVKKFSGLMIEGSTNAYKKLLKTKTWLVTASNLFVKQENIEQLQELILYNDPDVLSLDIDGNDYYILKLLLENGIKPKIIVVEYNSAFGPHHALTIQYQESFNMENTKFPYLYYGVSIGAWKKLLESFGYQFLTVESNGVNAFFVNPTYFSDEFLSNIKSLDFQENSHQRRLFKTTWEKQFEQIRQEAFLEV